MPTKQVTVIAYLTVQPGTEQGFLDQFGSIVTQTRAEPGCINYDFHQHMTDPYRFVFYENYLDQAAYETHRQEPYIQAWVEYARVNNAHFDVDQWSMLSSQASHGVSSTAS